MTMASNSQYKGIDRAFCVRMKSTLTKRGCHFKSSGYRVSKNIPIYMLYKNNLGAYTYLSTFFDWHYKITPKVIFALVLEIFKKNDKESMFCIFLCFWNYFERCDLQVLCIIEMDWTENYNYKIICNVIFAA